MGYPEIYYKQALQRFAYSLYFGSDNEKAERLSDEESIEKLEDAIKVQKENANAIDFIFNAGMSAGIVLKCADRDDGYCGFNACIDGLSEFETFVKGL